MRQHLIFQSPVLSHDPSKIKPGQRPPEKSNSGVVHLGTFREVNIYCSHGLIVTPQETLDKIG